MPIIYEVRTRAGDHVHGFGVRASQHDAELLLAETIERVGSRSDACWIEEIDNSGLFAVPPRPTPRERFSVRTSNSPSEEGRSTTVNVEVLDADRVVAAYARNYAMLQTFEPFRQGGRHYALVSPDYTGTSILDLESGEILGGEEPSSFGFCPVGFYVPDWWDVNDGTVLPGARYWNEDKEWPDGRFGFVWGCVWGDDSSWKVQFLDLSDVSRGAIRRDERFGYVELATDPASPGSAFVQVHRFEGKVDVNFRTHLRFNLEGGSPIDPLA